MADLFAVEEGAVDCCLAGLAEDGVEGFVAADVAAGGEEGEAYDSEEALEGGRLKSCRL